MKKIAYVLSALIVAMFLVASTASAVMYMDSQDQTTAGQNFTFLFDPVELSDGTDGTIIIEALGDYFGKASESLDFDVDGIFQVFGVSDNDSNVNVLSGDNTNDDIHWEGMWTIPGNDMLSITSNLDGTILVDLFTGVDVVKAGDFVKVTLEYNAVPIPGALILLGSGLLGLVGIRRKVLG